MGVRGTLVRRVNDKTIEVCGVDGSKLFTVERTSDHRVSLYGFGTELVFFAQPAISGQSFMQFSDTAGTGLIQFRAKDDNVIRMSTYGTGDIDLHTYGSGNIMMGTHSALGGATLSGYITIKDQGGTLRKLGVVS